MNSSSANLRDGRIIVKKWINSILAESRYLSIVTVVFVVSTISGYMNGKEIFQVVEKQGLLQQVMDIAKSIQENPSFFNAFWRIFLNNVFACFGVIFFGLFFGLISLFSVLTNGMILGTILKVTAIQTGQNPWWIFATTILPHGMIEIPAILLSAAFGLHLGMAVFRLIGCVFFPNQLEKCKLEWKGIKQRLPYVMITAVVMLLIAALIEAGLIIYVKPM